MNYDEIDKLIDDEYLYGEHGHFLKVLMEAWKRADLGNRELLAPVMEKIIQKYGFPSVLAKEHVAERLPV